MKPHHFIIPVLSIVGSGLWLSQQNQTIHELTEKNRIIRERVVFVEEVNSNTSSSVLASTGDEFTLPDGSLNWKLIAEFMGGARSSPEDMKSRFKLQAKMRELSEEYLIDGLAKIETLDIEPEDIYQLKQTLLSQLADTNPHLALASIGDSIPEDPSSSDSWFLSHLLSKVAEKDSAGAFAWLDRQIESGKIQSTSLRASQDLRLFFEGSILKELIFSDYVTANKRLSNFSEEEKFHLLSHGHYNLKGDKANALLKMAREVLSPEKATEAITSVFGNQYIQSLEKVDQSIKGIDFRQNEREQILSQLISTYARNTESEEKYTDIYEWSQTEAPEQAAELIAHALNTDENRWNNPQAVFEKAYAFAEAQEDPEILTAFVREFSAQRNKSMLNRQIANFKDPEVGKQYRTLVESLSQEISESE